MYYKETLSSRVHQRQFVGKFPLKVLYKTNLQLDNISVFGCFQNALLLYHYVFRTFSYILQIHTL